LKTIFLLRIKLYFNTSFVICRAWLTSMAWVHQWLTIIVSIDGTIRRWIPFLVTTLWNSPSQEGGRHTSGSCTTQHPKTLPTQFWLQSQKICTEHPMIPTSYPLKHWRHIFRGRSRLLIHCICLDIIRGKAVCGFKKSVL
jgi:hypothetical protein